MTQSITDTSYVFGHSEEEMQRLIRQSRLINPLTRRFLEQAGISTGMKVLDVGSGPGDVVMLLAERVGPGGAVVGVEIDPATLDIARARARRRRSCYWLLSKSKHFVGYCDVRQDHDQSFIRRPFTLGQR